MRKIESIEDQARGKITYELDNGMWVTLDARNVQLNGAEVILRRMGFGYLLPTGRIPVIQDGVMVGTLPADFDPDKVAIIRGFSMYAQRPGDFRCVGHYLVADSSLGAGDLALVIGFAPA